MSRKNQVALKRSTAKDKKPDGDRKKFQAEIIKALLKKIEKKIDGKNNGDLFVSVRQRTAAYKLYRKFWGLEEYGTEIEDEYLDDAYRFLNSYANQKFILYCAHMEKMEPMAYVSMLLGEDE